MKDLPRQVLCDLMTKYGQDLTNDGQRCEALLRDFCGKARSEISILIAALREGIVTELRSSKQTVSIEVLLPRLDQKLQDHLYLKPEAAMWAVDTWAIALGVMQQPRSQSFADSSPKSGQDDAKLDEPKLQPSYSYTVQQMWGMSGILLTGIIALAGLSFQQYLRTQKIEAEMQEKTQKIKAEAQEKTQKIEAEIQEESDRGFQDASLNLTGAEIRVKNSCSEPITIALRYKANVWSLFQNTSDTWRTEGLWQFKPGQSYTLATKDNTRIRSFSHIVYFYAQTTSLSFKTVRWEGAREFAVGNSKYPMRFRVLELDSSRNLRMELSC